MNLVFHLVMNMKEPPDGFESNNIWPWIYNRRLSYIRRPIIQFQISDERISTFLNLYNLIHISLINVIISTTCSEKKLI